MVLGYFHPLFFFSLWIWIWIEWDHGLTMAISFRNTGAASLNMDMLLVDRDGLMLMLVRLCLFSFFPLSSYYVYN